MKMGSKGLANFFHANGQFIDASGCRWIGREEIGSRTKTPFALFANKNAKYVCDDTLGDSNGAP